MNLWDALDRDFARVIANTARPIAPCPLLPASEMPDDRSDESREAAATGV